MLRTRRLLILLDYDGTLTPIVSHPAKAQLSPECRAVLRKLVAVPRFKVGIISGRRLNELRKLVDVSGIYYAGNHGIEINYRHKLCRHPDAIRTVPIITKVYRELLEKLKTISGVLIENKKFGVAVHYRLASSSTEIKRVKTIVRTLLTPYITDKTLKLMYGKKVIDIMPNIDWDKGNAVCWLLHEIEAEGGAAGAVVPIYIGDDKTDEAAFKALMRKNAITILVTARGKTLKSTVAQYWVRNVAEVKKVLDVLIHNANLHWDKYIPRHTDNNFCREKI